MREDTPSSGSRRVTVLDYIVEQMSPDTLQAIARGVVTFYAVGEQLSKRMVHHVQKIHRIESGNDSVTLQAIARGVVTFYAVGEQLSKRMVHHVQKIHRIGVRQ